MVYYLKMTHEIGGAYEATFPQFDTIIIKGDTLDEVLINAKKELTAYLYRKKLPESIRFEGEEYYPVNVVKKSKRIVKDKFKTQEAFEQQLPLPITPIDH